MNFEVYLEIRGRTTTVHLSGDLDITTAPMLRSVLDRVTQEERDRLVLDMHELNYMSSAGLRCLAVAHQQAGSDVRIILLGPKPEIVDIIRLAGLDQAVTIAERLT